MTKTVDVGGYAVTQQMLEGVHKHLIESHKGDTSLLKDGYVPSIDKLESAKESFSNGNEAVNSAEGYIYNLIASDGISAEVLQKCSGKARKQRNRVIILNKAGFPYKVAFATTHLPTRPEVKAWASKYKGNGTPWLWVKDSNESQTADILASIAVCAAHAMDRGQAPDGDIRYVVAHDLCEEINSHDLYGDNSKYNAMKPYKECALLLIDGMGNERNKIRELETVSEIINVRCLEGRPTVIASRFGVRHWGNKKASVDAKLAKVAIRSVLVGMGGYSSSLKDDTAREEIFSRLIDLDGNPTKLNR